MYRSYHRQLSQEARLIVRGRQEIVRDAAALWSRFLSLLGAGQAQRRPLPQRDQFAGQSFAELEPDLRKEQG